MASKDISIPDDVYRRLAEVKREGESFGGRHRPADEGTAALRVRRRVAAAELTMEAIREGRARPDEKLDRLYGDR